MEAREPVIAVVVPCYRVGERVLGTIAGIGPEVSRIYVVDDACPARSGDIVEAAGRGQRVTVIRHDQNRGVGGAVVTGYRAALDDGASIVVKLDGDGQADPALIPLLVAPLLAGRCDYVKGNRFFNPADLVGMPATRLFGNAVLSLFAKMSTGYWSVMDPTNGLTAITAPVLRLLPLDRLSKGYFFETDILFRLNTFRAVVLDCPMHAAYGDEESSLRIPRELPRFLFGHMRNSLRRILYGYFLRGFSIASIQLLLSVPLMGFGTIFGLYHWIVNSAQGSATPAGTVMVAALPIVIGVQLLLSFIAHDMQSEPKVPISRLLAKADS